MIIKQLLILLIMTLPIQAWSAYDLEKIKNGISSNKTDFKVTGWEKSNKHGWLAKTQLKRSTISVSEKRSQLIVPYINNTQKKSGKILCEKFATTAMDPLNDDELKSIKSAIRKATTRHKTKFLNLNNMKFLVTPKLIGAVVSLHCSVKPL